MKIPNSIQCTHPHDATAMALSIADGIPASWHDAIMNSGKSILASMDKKYHNRQLTAFGFDAWQYMRHLLHISPDAHTYTVNALAPLFMQPDGTPTDTVRRTMSQGIIKFSGLSFDFSGK